MADTEEFSRSLSGLKGRGHKAKALLLTCMDFRYPQAIVEYMESMALKKDYDHVILAGASLGATLDCGEHAKPHWQQTFFEHVAIAKILHDIKKVFILDHRDCGAYKEFLGLPPDVPREEEHRVHYEQIEKLSELIRTAHPDLGVEADLLEKIDEKTFKFHKMLSR